MKKLAKGRLRATPADRRNGSGNPAKLLLDAVRIARSGIVDLEFYGAQTGRSFRNPIAVARDYLAAPTAAGLSLHPLFEPEFVDRKSEPGTEPVLRYLTEKKIFGKVSPHPLFDLPAAKRELRAAGIAYPKGAWLTWVRSASVTSPVPVSAGATTVAWGELRDELIRCALKWRTGGAAPAEISWATVAARSEPGLTSVVVPIAGDLANALGRLILLKGSAERELVCTGFTSRAQFSCFTALAKARPIVVVHAPDNTLARQWNLGASASSGDRLVFVAPNARLDGAAIDALSAALDDPETAITQPLNETPEMTIQSAGAYFAPEDSVPSPMLTGHPTADAQQVGSATIPATLSGVVALRRQILCSLTGFDEQYGNDFAEVDLSLRAVAAGLGRVTLEPGARATIRSKMPKPFRQHPAESARLLQADHRTPPAGSSQYLETAGFRVAGHREQQLEDGPSLGGSATVHIPELARLTSGIEALPRLRWTIDTPVTAGWWAQIWGDWHFANSLAGALRRLGQHVAVDTRQARERDSRRFDDVLLTLRGTDAVQPAGTQVNLMWVLYDSDSVTAAEVAAYDQVFAASISWADERSGKWGYPIEALLQCTDTQLFYPGRAGSAPNNRVLFVGNTRRGTPRPIVDAALAANVGLDLYGTGWDEIPSAAGKVVARKVSNAELGRLYAESGVVLNDHRDDMRRAGFISNRLFDAVACGARVLSDPIPGAAELFAGSVQFCEATDVAERLTEPFDLRWPEEALRLATAERVRSEHSFDQRARVLLARAVEVLQRRAQTDSAPA